MKKLFILLAAVLTFTTPVFAEIGSLSSDLVFTPVTPCRIVDTRNAPAGPVPAGATRVFKAWAASYTAQGGSGTDCGLLQSNDIAALALNLLVIVPAGEGFIKAWPVGVAQPNASTLNYKANDVLANSAVLKVSQTTSEWNLYTVSTTHFAADVVGYYSKPVATALNCTTVSGVATNVAAGAYTSLPTLFCPAGYTTMGLSFSAAENVLMADSYTLGTAGQIFVRSLSVNAQNVTAKLQCCQIPGR
jgi:hypothetical protein